MKKLSRILTFLLIIVPTMVWGVVSMQDDKTRRNTSQQQNTPSQQSTADQKGGKTAGKNATVVKQQVVLEEDTIPDSLLHPRWKIQRTMPITFDDLDQGAADLKRPDNIKQDVAYNDTIERYVIGTKMGNTWLSAPVMMSMTEYLKWSEEQQRRDFFRKKNDEVFVQKGKEKFDFTDMHFDLGPAEKIFGPGGVRIKTQGTAELKFGVTMKNIENPSLPVRNRNTTTIDFDEKINANITGKIGDKMNLNINYNTDATFEFDAQNMKLKYEGKEDEIIKLVEAGNVSFPSNSSLINGASSLFGLRTDMQFGKLKLQTVISQKKSTSSSVSSKGGTQMTPFQIDVTKYDGNRHFFLSHYFRDKYDEAMQTLPNIMTGINITRVEIWVTNKSGQTSNTRNIVALTDLGESVPKNHIWGGGDPNTQPSNNANIEYNSMVTLYADARDVNKTTSVLDAIDGVTGGNDYEKLESAQLLPSSAYRLNSALGYVSLTSGLQTDQVLAVAYEYTHNGVTYQVGEFSSDISDVNSALFVKSLKNTANTPAQGNWDLMMKNVYSIGSTVEKEKFRLDVKYLSDTAGVYLNYLPDQRVKETTLLKVLGADRLDNNMKVHSNGYFDYVEGYTVSNGCVFLPKVEPFGEYMYGYLRGKGFTDEEAKKYCFFELYDNILSEAQNASDKNKYLLQGQFKGSQGNTISLGATNIPQGSVVVTAGGVTLTEGSDYTVDYYSGEVKILNQSIIDAGTNVNVSLESNNDWGQQRKTMFGVNWEYDFSKNFQMSGTLQHLSEQSLVTKVAMGAEPVNNTLWGVNMNWKKESQWLTNVLDKVPFLNVSAPSNIQFNAEFAHLIAGQASGTQDNASYIDDFENTKNGISVMTPTSWVISSTPSLFPESLDKAGVTSGYNRSRLAWYTIDPLFTRRSSTLTPGHIRSDLDQLSNHYVREVPVMELYPNRDQNTYEGATSTLSILNLAYYPEERGPYNFNPQLTMDGKLTNPSRSWGGMMRKLDTNDFEQANIEYIEFWMLDPFIYTRRDGTASKYGGDLYFNLGEVSEDILKDGRKFAESSMESKPDVEYKKSQWGNVPSQSIVTYSFATSGGSREQQDVGYDGLTDDAERDFYKDYWNGLVVNDSVKNAIKNDPSNDNYHYFRGSDWDEQRKSILERYKYINSPQGNSPDSDSRSENYDTSYKTTPDVEDINQDYTLNEYERYWQYKVSIRPEDLVVGQNYIVDKRVCAPKLRNGNEEEITWYQFRIPLRQVAANMDRHGDINDFSSIRFMRMFMTGFEKPIVLRLASLDLVRGEWRVYDRNINTSSANTGTVAVSAVNIEENNDKTPVNYILPPGITRIVDPSQPQLTEDNEQAMCFIVDKLSHGDAKAVYKTMNIDMRQYKHLQMFVHANALDPNTSSLQDDQLAVFVRLGSDYSSNYYEYEIPLKITAPGKYSAYSNADRRLVWPADNMLDIKLSLLTGLKKKRNQAKSQGLASYNREYSAYDEGNPKNKITVMGNPSLGDVKTIMIGVRNLSNMQKSGEVWVNELRLRDTDSGGGWAALANLNVQLSDFGSINAMGKHVSEGFGGLEESIASRTTDNYSTYSITTNFELGKFFPEKAKVQAPLYYSMSRERTAPKYNPLDNDMLLDDALDAAANKHEKDSIQSIAVRSNVQTNLSLSGVRFGIATKRHPMPYDPANFTFSYSHSHNHSDGETTVYENEDQWHGSIAYSWTPVFKPLEPFKGIKSKSKYYDILKKFALNWLPQNIGVNTEMRRSYYELQERDLEDLGSESNLPLTFSSQFLWNRDFTLRWDLTKNLHMNFQSGTHAEIEEPYAPVNKDLYPDRYEAWKDSVWTSIKKMGTPLDYRQTFTASYKVPINLIPIFDWVNADASYNAAYNWNRGTELEDGTSLGNTIATNRTLNINGTFNMEKLYDHVPFLKKTNERFKKSVKSSLAAKKQQNAIKKSQEANKKKEEGETAENKNNGSNAQKALPKNSKTFEREITINADTSIVISHGKKSRRLIVSARNAEGKLIPVKYKVVDDNKIKLTNKLDSAVKMKISVTAKEPLENKTWYRTTQSFARLLMSIRNINLSYRNQYSLALPGFMPAVGDVFGQKKVDNIMSPGLDFAFGVVDDSYIEKARGNGWLLSGTTVATPATSSKTEDLQLKMTLEPARNLKIDMNASRTMTRTKSVQYMYSGNPTTQSGTFTMTTISIKSAMEGMGTADNGYHSASFEKFCGLLEGYRQRVEAQYEGATYPKGTEYAGQPFRKEVAGVNKYSADVMVPAFLNAYTGMNSLSIFPALTKMLPNWSVKYSGLGELAWFNERFKSVNLSHSYKSVYAVGSYSSFATFMEYMGDNLGFIQDATTGSTLPVPNSMYNVSQVSINEAFSPLIGVDVTLLNNMTLKLEYRTTRVLNLSMSSVQVNETLSKDWVFGMGYKLNDFKLFGGAASRKMKGSGKGNAKDDKNNASKGNTSSKTKGFNHDLNLRLDFSLRNQAAITRDIAQMISAASSGNRALKLSFSADYTLSKLMTVSFYYDRQVNTPLLTSSSYPTTTQDFGLSMKFSLTR